ncbi:unnamed protein product [Rhizophagus irregularis]|nr:unnamed protein product [Rhizophagus irregularis]CAB5373802.1 unnamed protein product [Rhizophagus irregularis]
MNIPYDRKFLFFSTKLPTDNKILLNKDPTTAIAILPELFGGDNGEEGESEGESEDEDEGSVDSGDDGSDDGGDGRNFRIKNCCPYIILHYY